MTKEIYSGFQMSVATMVAPLSQRGDPTGETPVPHSPENRDQRRLRKKWHRRLACGRIHMKTAIMPLESVKDVNSPAGC
jgi:hypothetical protein